MYVIKQRGSDYKYWHIFKEELVGTGMESYCGEQKHTMGSRIDNVIAHGPAIKFCVQCLTIITKE